MKKTFIKKGFREIWTHKVQYFLLALVIGLGVATYSSFNDFSRYRKEGLDHIYSESNFMDLQVTLNYGAVMNTSDVEGLMESDGYASRITEWEMRLVYEVFMEHEHEGEPKKTKGQVMGLMVPEGSSPKEAVDVNTPLFYVDDPDEYSGEPECYLERKFAKAYGFGPGDEINVNRGKVSRNLTILEQVAVPEYFMVIREGDLTPSERSFGVLLLPLEQAMNIFSGPGWEEPFVNEVVLTVEDGTDIDLLKSELEESFEKRGVAVEFTEKDENPARYFLITDYENDKDSMSIFPVVIFAVSGFGLVMALRRMIRTHRPQIGIFKALGMKSRTILIFFAVIAIVVALLGSVLGWVLSIPLNLVWKSLGERLLDFPVEEYNITYIYYVYGALISLVLCMACTMIPAALAVRVKPIDVIQGKEGVSKKQVGRLGGVMGRTRFLPVSLKLTIRNQLRKPFKSLSTIIGVAMSLSLFLGFMMVFDSALSALDTTTDGMKWDYEVTMEEPQPMNITGDWMDMHEGIEGLGPAMKLPSKLDPLGDNYDSLLYSTIDLEKMFDIDLQSGSIKQGKVIISWYHADKMDLGPGDKVPMMLPRLDMTGNFSTEIVEVEISGIQSNHIGTTVFMDLETFWNLTGLKGLVNSVYIQTVDGEKIRELENDLITRKGISSVTHIDEKKGLLEQYLDIFIGAVAVMAVISIMLAGSIVYTMFRISAREQERDYATMKTLGTTQKKVAKLIFQEGAYITVLGVGLGVLGAYGLANYMLTQNDEWESFGLETQFSPLGFSIGAIMIVFTVLFVSFLTLRYIGRINIANVIRERTSG